MQVIINIEKTELDKFIERMVFAWWESHEDGCCDPDCEMIIDWIDGHMAERAQILMCTLGDAYEMPYTDVVFQLNGKPLDRIGQDEKLQKIINKHWKAMTKEDLEPDDTSK